MCTHVYKPISIVGGTACCPAYSSSPKRIHTASAFLRSLNRLIYPASALLAYQQTDLLAGFCYYCVQEQETADQVLGNLLRNPEHGFAPLFTHNARL